MKRAIQVDHETYAEIVADNPKITIEDLKSSRRLAMKKLPRPGRERQAATGKEHGEPPPWKSWLHGKEARVG